MLNVLVFYILLFTDDRNSVIAFCIHIGNAYRNDQQMEIYLTTTKDKSTLKVKFPHCIDL